MVFWKKKKPDVKPEESTELTLSDIIRGLQHCVISSRDISVRQHLSDFNTFIDDNTGKPYTKTVMLNDEAVIDVPWLCMYNHQSIDLDEMEVKLNLVVKNTSLKMPEQIPDLSDKNSVIYPDYLTRTCFKVDLLSAKDDSERTHLDLKFKFKSGSPPEAVSRVIEKLNAQIVAYVPNPELQNKSDVSE